MAAIETKTTAQALPLRARIRLSSPIHAFWSSLRLVGLRDRLRCPSCKAIGTWKPHGTWVSRWRDGDRPVRRWMCKWCGRYEGPEGLLKAWINHEAGCWALPYPVDSTAPHEPGPTPAELVKAELGGAWPWRG
jgi:hypothetical protein